MKMIKYLNIVFFTSLALIVNNLNADTLSEDASKRGINETCGSYLNQIEESYGLNGLNITCCCHRMLEVPPVIGVLHRLRSILSRLLLA